MSLSLLRLPPKHFLFPRLHFEISYTLWQSRRTASVVLIQCFICEEFSSQHSPQQLKRSVPYLSMCRFSAGIHLFRSSDS